MFQSIKSRLLVIFLSLSIISVSIFILSFLLIRSNEEKFISINRDIDAINKYILRDIKVTRDFFSNETINSHYFETGQSEYLKAHQKIMSAMKNRLASLRKKDDELSFGLKDNCDRLTQELNLYSKTIDTIVNQINIRGFKDYRLEGRMRELAHQLEGLKTVIGAEEILTLRKHEKDFIIRQDEAYQEKFHIQANTVKQHLVNKLGKDRSKELTGIIDLYSSKFDSLVMFDKLIGIKSQRGLKKRIDLLAERTDATLTLLQTNATAKGENNSDKLRNIIIYFWILIAFIGVWICIILAQKASRSIVSLKEKMEEFIASDFTKRTVLPIKNSNNEIDVLSNNFSILEQHIVNQMRALRVKNKELEMFIYRASHDVKTPLTSLNKILERTKKTSGEPLVIEQLERGNNIVESLKDILEELSLVRSIHIGPTEVQEIDAFNLVKKCISGFQAIKGFDDIVFRTNIKIQNAFFSDIKFVRIILRNLVENSIKYRSVGSKTSFVDISFEELENRMVKITVTDNGIGIKKELQKNVFDIFFRATEEQNGNGLGLYIVQNALQKLHGAIKVKSEEGKGSTFIVYLPDATRMSNHAQRIIENKIVFPSRDEFALDYL